MSSSQSPQAPSGPPNLFAGRPPLDIVAPIALSDDDRVDLAGRYSHRWGLPLRLVHVNTPDDPTDGGAALDVAVTELSVAHDDLAITGETVEAESVAAGIGAAATNRSVVFLPSERGSRWLDGDSVGVGVVQTFSGLVMLYGPGCHEPPVGTSIIVPLDGTRFAEQALEPAVALASQSGASVWLVTVGPAASIDAVSEMMLEGVADSEQRYLEHLVTTFSDSPIDVRWETTNDDDPIAGIDAIAAEHGSSLIVAATHADTDGSRDRFGSICMGLVAQGRIPVLMVTPGAGEAPEVDEPNR